MQIPAAALHLSEKVPQEQDSGRAAALGQVLLLRSTVMTTFAALDQALLRDCGGIPELQ